MKTSPLSLLISLLALSPTVLAQAPPEPGAGSHGDPYTPVGTLQVTPEVVQPNVQPDMAWGITYPRTIGDFLTIVPPGELIMGDIQSETLEVRPVGQCHDANCETNSGGQLRIAFWVRINNGSWDLVFYGTEDDVKPNQKLVNDKVYAGDTIDFAIMGQTPDGSWDSLYWTVEDTPNIVALIDGDQFPSDSADFVSGDYEDYLSQYVDDDGTVALGPSNILFLVEVGSDTVGDPCFDLQDFAFMVTFKNNNGHGNNEDGVDVSNPGQGNGGPNGQEDESGFIDDEKKKIKKK